MISRSRGHVPPTGIAAQTSLKITRVYLVAVALIAVTVVISGMITSANVRRQESYAGIINTAGAQRMLSQRIAALVGLSVRPDGEAARAELMAAVARMTKAHHYLVADPDAPARRSAELEEYYFKGPEPLDTVVSGFLHRATELEQAIGNGNVSMSVASTLRSEALGPLLIRLQGAVQLHEAAAISDAARLVRIEWLVVGITLLVLALEVTFIFRPLASHTKRLTHSLEVRANTDPLTGLLNRGAILDALCGVAEAKRPLAAIVIDLDWFKEVNEAEGHAGGDAILREVAQRLRYCVRPVDIVGRIGGDEFLAILVGFTDRDAVDAVAQRINVSLNRCISHNSRQIRVGATIGIAMCPGDAHTPEMVMLAADDALMRLKHESRGGIAYASPLDAARIARDSLILRKLGEADSSLPGIHAHYQPIVTCHRVGGEFEIVGLEVLARWHDPSLGEIAPGDFLPVAQRAGRHAWLTSQVRQSALHAFAALRSDGFSAGRLSLNISAAEVARGDIVDVVLADVAMSGLPLSSLTLEITEDLLLDRVSNRTLEQFAVLRERGVKISLDDFGTGTSGLSHLLRLNLDQVKIDKTFVQSIATSPRSAEIVRATVALGRSIGFDVVAEGIETPEQARCLQELGCMTLQGFLFARPMPATALRSWLLSRRPSHHAPALRVV